MELNKYKNEYFESFINLIDESFRIANSDKKALVKWKFFYYI